VFAQRATLPDIAGVAEAYIGVVPAKEYLQLVTDEAGQIRKSLFYDNVRDFQGENPVNSQIAATLRSDRSERFAVLNNGVTIVARELRTTGDKLFIKDYQIVNGGQTTHVLFSEQEDMDDSVAVPVKVIGTDDEDLITAIITATNNQTEIKAEELNARAEFERGLEQFFATFDEPKDLYYERRSRQFDHLDVERVRILSRQQLVRTFASMYLDEPHRATGYVPQLMAQLGDQLFNDNHRLEPYYAAAFAHYKLEFFWRNGQLNRRFKPGRWQILMAARYLACGSAASLESKKAATQANALAARLWNDEEALEMFESAIAVVLEATDDSWQRDEMRNRPTTDDVLKKLHNPVTKVLFGS
jgi:AIPR protein